MVPFCLSGVVNLRLHGFFPYYISTVSLAKERKLAALRWSWRRNEVNGVFYQS